MMKKIKQKIFKIFLKYNNKATEVLEETKNTNFTKKVPKFIATFCGTSLISIISPMTVFAASTDSIDTFVAEIGKWLIKIGVVVAMVGGVMFALGWQREDSEGKSRGLLTIMAGFMVAAIGASPAAFGFTS